MTTGVSHSRQATCSPPILPTDQKTYHWLWWLHSKLKQDNTTEFLIESMQPYWLETPQQKYLYHICLGLITGVLIGLIYKISTGWIGAGIGGVAYGLILGCTQKIYPISSLKFSVGSAKERLLPSILEGLWWGVVYGMIDALICGLIWGGEGLIWGMIQVLIWGLVEGLIWGLTVPEFKSITISNQGIRESAQNAVAFTLIGTIAWLLIYVLILMAVAQPLEPFALLVDSIGCGLFFGIYIGGLACLQHFVLRLLLWCKGYIPWNYAKFLDDATERGLLEREGGRYRFNHKQWQEYSNCLQL
jgi:hypothetical protein